MTHCHARVAQKAALTYLRNEKLCRALMSLRYGALAAAWSRERNLSFELGEVRPPEAPAIFTQLSGEMAERIRNGDWEHSPLGPASHWSEPLCTLLGLILSSSQPMFVIWGEGRALLYNDASIPLLGRKHPEALGRHALAEVWAEARRELAPLFEQVFSGNPVQMEDLALVLDRQGYAEEAHFSVSYTPVRDADGGIRGLFGVCAETTAQVRERREAAAKEEALHATAAVGQAAAERIELALRAGAIIGTWVWDVPRDLIFADQQFAQSFGLDPALCELGLPLATVMESIHPDDRDRVVDEIGAAMARGGPYRCEYRVRHSNGTYRWTDATGEAELDADGAARRFPGVLVDSEDRRRVDEALSQSNALLRTFTEAVPGVIYAKDLEGRLLVGNRGTAELLGRSYEDFIGRTDLELLEDKAEGAAIMSNDRRIMASGVAEQIEERVALPDGSEAWWHSTKAPLRNERGEVIGLVGSSVDITERRRAEEHRILLVNELNHRVKNTLAVVQGLARRTFRGAEDGRAALESFESRLTALSRAHNLLTDENWTSANLRDIVADQLGADRWGDRLVLDGPDVSLSPQVAVSVALVLHELGTNATKYGALSNDVGQVDARWRLVPERSAVTLRWVERGGPPVQAPQKQGFGSRMIERALASEVGGQVALQFLPEGVVCEIEAPVLA